MTVTVTVPLTLNIEAEDLRGLQAEAEGMGLTLEAFVQHLVSVAAADHRKHALWDEPAEVRAIER